MRRLLSLIKVTGIPIRQAAGIAFGITLSIVTTLIAEPENDDILSFHIDRNVSYSQLFNVKLYRRLSTVAKVDKFVDKHCSFTADLETTQSDIFQWIYWFASTDGALAPTQAHYTLSHSVIPKSMWKPSPDQTKPLTIKVNGFLGDQAIAYLSARAHCDYIITSGAKAHFDKPINLNYADKPFTNIIDKICAEQDVKWIPTSNDCILYYLTNELRVSGSVIRPPASAPNATIASDGKGEANPI